MVLSHSMIKMTASRSFSFRTQQKVHVLILVWRCPRERTSTSQRRDKEAPELKNSLQVIVQSVDIGQVLSAYYAQS